MSIKKDILWRFGVVYVGILLLGLGIVARIIYLQFVEVGELTKKAQQLSVRNMEIIPNRGNILACDGRLLATSVPYYEIRVDLSPAVVPNSLFRESIDSLALRLSQIFKDKSPQAYKSELIKARKENNRYYLLKRKVDFEQLRQLKACPIFRLGKNKGGLIIEQTGVRFMPHGDLAARTIGYLSRSENGNEVGIEGSFDTELAGVKGLKVMQRVPGGVWMPINDENEIEPKDGYDVVTTIDLNIQDVAQEALRRQLELHNAQHGVAILMEVQSGEIKAIANLGRDEAGRYREVFNYAIGESTEPGSTIKLASYMAALEDGYIDLNDTIDTGKGKWKIYDKEITDSHKGGLGKITVKQAFAYSSNVAVSKIIMQYYKGKEIQFVKHFYDFGLNKKLGLQIQGEAEPLVKYPGTKYWSGITMAMMSFGYEIKLTPLQILAFYNAVANNGRLVRPLLVKELRFNGRTVKRFEPEVIIPSICSMSTIRKAREMLEAVVKNGTAKNLDDSLLQIAGKTGTAQIAIKNLGYRKGTSISYQASFVGYFPANNPKYSCIVVVNAPSNDVYYGNLVAGPIFKEIAQKVYATSFELHNEVIKGKRRLKTATPELSDGFVTDLEKTLQELGISYDKSDDNALWVSPKKQDSEVILNKRLVIDNLVPNVVGMGAKDAVYLSEKAGLRPVLIGFGKVVKQSIPPGIQARKGDSFVLTLQAN
ncbi:MAG: transpeptidase family protein [Bacteroidales bacterium]|nr:transpeptidase family protein [Bacteroidales bacterium]